VACSCKAGAAALTPAARINPQTLAAAASAFSDYPSDFFLTSLVPTVTATAANARA
jgi:hypothetical protein